MSKVKSQTLQLVPQSDDLVRVILPYREEGHFAFSEYEISKEILEQSGKKIFKSEYDIFAIVKEQITNKVLDILGL